METTFQTASPVVHLDGFTLKAGHNLVNGLAWGPDGWLTAVTG